MLLEKFVDAILSTISCWFITARL